MHLARMSAAGRRAVIHCQKHTDVLYLRRENVTFIEPQHVAPKQSRLESSRLRCLGCPSTDALSTLTIQQAEVGNRH